MLTTRTSTPPSLSTIVTGPVIVAVALGTVVLGRSAEADPQYFHVLIWRLRYGRYYGPVPFDARKRKFRFWQLQASSPAGPAPAGSNGRSPWPVTSTDCGTGRPCGLRRLAPRGVVPATALAVSAIQPDHESVPRSSGLPMTPATGS
ncbi:MAG: hypothetical protein OXL68_01530 [Paracoccaceae bacterium]|nr:hypothetical protein [Paracoccaceae bacterium]